MQDSPVRNLLAITLVFGLTGGTRAWSQDGVKPKDDALDSLIEKLANPDDKADSKSDKKSEPAGGETPKAPKAETTKPEGGSASRPKEKPAGGPSSTTPPKAKGSDAVSSKDQELDSLLEKLGESKDAPTAEDQPPGSHAGQGEPKQPSGGQKPDPPKLGGKDKDLDERLEELTGRKRRRNGSDEQRSGPVGEIIKEMRDVEERLGKPDSSEATRNKQKQIVKNIDTLIEQVRKSGSSSTRLMLRRVRGGQQPGQQPGDQPGALARGAGPMKPARPTTQHSTAGGKDVWGHLPAELRDVMEASFKEQSLTAKAELIRQYFLSVGKGKLVREQ